MRAVCVVASILVGASADSGGCVLDPSVPNACGEGISLADSASLLQMKATEHVQHESKAAALTETTAVTQRCSESLVGACEFTDWSAWSSCSKTCGTGTQTRTRQTKNPDKCHSGVCLKEGETCNVKPCPDPKPDPTPNPTEAPPTPPPLKTEQCRMYGDPHFIAFDADKKFGDTARISTDGVGVLWAVKSDSVKLQVDAREKEDPNKGNTGWGRSIGLAIAGDMLKNSSGYEHRLVFLKEGKRTLLDGKEIVIQNGSQYTSNDGLIQVKHFASMAANWEEWTHQGYSGINENKFLGHETWIWSLAHKKISIYFTLADSICALIRMPKVEGMDGFCGNFDGNATNDVEGNSKWKTSTKELSKRMGFRPTNPDLEGYAPHGTPRWVVMEKKDEYWWQKSPGLFAAKGQALLGEEDRVVRRPTKEWCDAELYKKAEDQCAGIDEQVFKKGCIYDICVTKHLEAADNDLDSQVLDTVDKAEQAQQKKAAAHPRKCESEKCGCFGCCPGSETKAIGTNFEGCLKEEHKITGRS